MDYGSLSNLGINTAPTLPENNQSKRTTSTKGHDESIGFHSNQISKSPQNLVNSATVAHTSTLDSSMFNTLESDLETLLADWPEDGASFPHFTTTLHGGNNIQ